MIKDRNNDSSNKVMLKNSMCLQKLYYHLPVAVQAWLTRFIFHPHFAKHTLVYPGRKSYYGNVSFGDWTSIGGGDSCFANVTVGKYTMFARGFRSIHFIHDYHAFTNNDGIKQYISKLNQYNIKDSSVIEPRAISYSQTIIGNDVWFGEDVTVIGGVNIGDGAVIAARSVVTHDVAPYSVVGGVPARFIKWRFDEDTRNYMEELQWWNWSQEKIVCNYERLCRFDRSLLSDTKL